MTNLQGFVTIYEMTIPTTLSTTSILYRPSKTLAYLFQEKNGISKQGSNFPNSVLIIAGQSLGTQIETRLWELSQSLDYCETLISKQNMTLCASEKLEQIGK